MISLTEREHARLLDLKVRDDESKFRDESKFQQSDLAKCVVE